MNVQLCSGELLHQAFGNWLVEQGQSGDVVADQS